MADKQSSISEYKCAICLEILIEPVVLPCKHEMCRPCFRKNVEEANFLCPMCRKRIASWTRKCMREGTLVDQNRWNKIQKLFPDKCLRRLNGDDESEDESYQPPTKRVLAKSGELRKEYEQEMKKILEEKVEEERASKDFIKTILEEEQALQQQQEISDEDFARRLSEELKNEEDNKESDLKNVGNGLKSPSVSLKTASKVLKRKKMDSKSPGRSYSLKKYFPSKNKQCENLPTNKPNNNVLGEPRHGSDFELAMELQRQFDREAVAINIRDDYMLRQTSSSHSNKEHTAIRQKHQDKTKELKGKQTVIVDKLFNKNIQKEEESNKFKADAAKSQNNEIQILRDRTMVFGHRKDESVVNDEEL